MVLRGVLGVLGGGALELAGEAAGVLADPAGEVGVVAEAALSGDVADALVGTREEHLGLLEADAGDVVHDGHAALAAEGAGEGAAGVVELVGEVLGGEVGVGEALADLVSDELDDGGGLGLGELAGDGVEGLDGEEAAAAAALDGLVLEGGEHGLEVVAGRRAEGVDAGAEPETVGELLGEGAVGGEPAHLGALGLAPEGVGLGGEVDGDLARAEGGLPSADGHGGATGDDPLDEDESAGEGLAESAEGHAAPDDAAEHDGKEVGPLVAGALRTFAADALDPVFGHTRLPKAL